MQAQKKWTVTGCSLWIIGLTVFIVGLNMSGDTRSWMTLAGSVAFLIGLGITGALWMKQKMKDEKKEAAE